MDFFVWPVWSSFLRRARRGFGSLVFWLLLIGHFFGAWLCGGGVAADASDPLGDVLSRRALSRPRLQFRSDFPTARVLALRFLEVNEKLRLYAAGEGKQVRSWDLFEQPDGQLRPQVRQPHTWPQFFDKTGTIYSLAVQRIPAKEGRQHDVRLLFGGFGIKHARVNWVRESARQTPQALLASKRRAANVWSIDLHPDPARRLAAVGYNVGGVALWSLQGYGQAERLPMPPAGRPLQPNRHSVLDRASHVAFSPEGNKLAVVGLVRKDLQSQAKASMALEVWAIGGPGTPAVFLERLPVPAASGDFFTGLGWLDENRWVLGTRGGVFAGGLPQGLRQVSDDLRLFIGQPGQVTFSNQAFYGRGLTLTLHPQQANQQRLPLPLGKSHTLAVRGNLPHTTNLPDYPTFPVPAGNQLTFVPHVSALAAIARQRQVLVSIYDRTTKTYTVEVQNAAGRRVLELESGHFDGLVSSVVASPSGRYLAAATLAGGNEARWQIYVWDYQAAQGGRCPLVARLPDPTKPQETIGQPIANVRLLDMNRKDNLRPDAVSFAFATAKFGQPPPASQYVLKFSDGSLFPSASRIRPGNQPQTPQVWYKRESQNGFWTFLPQNQQQNNGRPKLSVARVPQQVAENRRPLPTAAAGFHKAGREWIAVGYPDGVRIWPVGAPRAPGHQAAGNQRAGQPGKLGGLAPVRHFYGHSGPVTTLAVDPQGRFLVSGGTDGTIAAWGIATLGSDQTNELGIATNAIFPAGRGRLIVTKVNPFSPGDEAGFSQGDEVLKVQVRGRSLQVDPRQPQSIEQAKKLLDTLAGDREVVVTVLTQGARKRDLLAYTSWDPLWRYFPLPPRDRRSVLLEGAVTTASGAFDASPGAGRYLHWHQNFTDQRADVGDRDRAVFLPYGLVNSFEKPELVRKIVQGPLPIGEPLPTFQVLTFDWTLGPDPQAPEKVDIHIPQVTGKLQPNQTLEVWLNSRRLKRVTAKDLGQGGSPLTCQINPGDYRQGPNDLLALIAPVAGQAGQAVGYRWHTFFHQPAGPRRRQLHFLGVGVSQYAQANALKLRWRLDQLSYCHKDVQKVAQALKKLPRGRYQIRPQNIRVLPNQLGTTAAVTAELVRLAQVAKPDDLVLVMLSGHGMGPSPGVNQFVFVTFDTKVNLEATGLTRSTLQEHLSQLSCPSAVLLDTCRAGAAGRADAHIKALGGFQLGPQILASCGQDDNSLEVHAHQILRPVDRDPGGIFTLELVRLLANPPGKPLTLLSLFEQLREKFDRVDGSVLGDYQLPPQVPAEKLQQPHFLPSLTARPDELLLRP